MSDLLTEMTTARQLISEDEPYRAIRAWWQELPHDDGTDRTVLKDYIAGHTGLRASFLDEGELGFGGLVGHTCPKVYTDKIDSNDAVIFVLDTGDMYALTHDQDCCEDVYLEDIVGDLQDLVGSEILMAEEEGSDRLDSAGLPQWVKEMGDADIDDDEAEQWGTQTWTFYKLATKKGYVTLRFYGASNGYYSESVDLYRTDGFHIIHSWAT